MARPNQGQSSSRDGVLWLLGLFLVGCGDPIEPAVPQVPSSGGPIVIAPPRPADPPAPSPEIPVLASLAAGARPPCDAAADLRKQADLALAQGRAYKAVRSIETADKKCPTTAQASWKTRLDALSKLGRD